MKNKAFKGFINGIAFTSTALLLISLGKYKIEKDSDEKPFTKIIKNIDEDNSTLEEIADYTEIIINDFIHNNETTYIKKRHTEYEEYLSNKQTFKDETQLLSFFKKLEKHLIEYYKNSIDEEIKKEQEYIQKISISFIISKQKIGNYTYESLSNESKQSILNIANNFLYIKENGYPKEEENIQEYQKQLKQTIKYFLHQN